MIKDTHPAAKWEKSKAVKRMGKARKRIEEDDQSMMAEFNAMRAASNRAKQERLAKADPTGWTQHTPWHWSRYIDGRKLDYWPSKAKWQYDGKVMSGDVKSFVAARSR